MNKAIQGRNSNFELLRILSIILITLHHITFSVGIDSGDMYVRLWGQFFYIGGKVGVNCFVLISGYFLSQKQFDIMRIVKTHSKVSVYCLFGLVVTLLVFHSVGVFDILKSVFPVVFNTYWFVSAYIGMLIFTPILNFLVQKADIHHFSILIICCLLLFTIIPTFTAQTIFNSNVTWFCFMYLLAAYFRKYNTCLKQFLSKKWVFFSMWMLIWCASVVFTIGETWFPVLKEGTNFFTGMYILPQLINSVSLFLIFENMQINAKWIKFAGGHTFAGYLLQSNFLLASFFADFYIKSFDSFPAIMYPVVAIACAIMVILFAFVVDIIVDVILQFKYIEIIEKKIVKILETVINILKKIFTLQCRGW